MKKMKLRAWVKVVITLSILVAVVILADNYTKKAVDQCIAGGNSRTYCEKVLYD